MRSTTGLAATALALALTAPAFGQKVEPRVLPSAAAHYGEYQGDVTAIQAAPLKSGKELDSALDTFGAQNPDQLSSGWIAYSAMVAAQDKDFAAAVKDIDAYYGRERVMTGFRNDVAYARTLKGGEAALQDALSANSRDAGRISSAAAFVKDQAYKLQDVAWGKTRLPNASGVANGLKATAKTVRPVNEAAQKLFAGPDLGIVLSNAHGEKSVWDKVSILASAPTAALTTAGVISAPAAPLKVDPKREGTANRIVTLAAFHVLEAEKTNKAT